ncbi:1,3-beta-glucanosyltransferase Gel1 [Lineolata rhizophorae]|uniref:1,3-beta-glucanosyltransferase n=1 Tax=Lineolata rhizophorae TaxID=578093 RepID=A0A6A6NMX8_9PEZI|nr:1,3-beta-glucanosyltransferase Gel1 [Lineolata rhizophorae]
MKGLYTAVAAAAIFPAVLAKPSKTFNKRADTSVTGSLPTVTTKGNAFMAGDDRFYIRGVDYQPGGSSDLADPIADVDGCRRDVAKFQELGINTIRVYTIDNSADHDECMSMLDDAGIYLALDVNTPDYSINRADPHRSYNDVYLQNVFATVDKFVGYSNTLLFFSANEVINDNLTTNCAPYVKATTRDIKQYIHERGYRKVPVGYSAADVDSNRYEMASYMNCGSDDERSDFFAFNDYSWCDPSSFTQSGWDQKVEQYSNYSIPLFLSEFGCTTNTREFNEIASLYSDDMTPVYSGGLVYEYSNEDNGFGLVEITGSSVRELDDFSTLKDALAATEPPSGDGGARLDNPGPASECPAQSDVWDVEENTLPNLPEPAQRYFDDGAGDGPGLDGDGSQTAGTASESDSDIGSGGDSTSEEGEASTSTGAATSVRVPEFSVGVAPLVCAGMVLASSLFGAALV